MNYQIDHGSPDEMTDESIAREVAVILNRYYPNHPWLVSFQGHAIIIRHLAIALVMQKILGMSGFGACLPKSAVHTPAQLRQSVRHFGGEMLEAFGLSRGKWDGSEPRIPKNWGTSRNQRFQ